jgi:hypothetical protein
MRLIWTLVSLGIVVTVVLVIVCNIDDWTSQMAGEADRATAEAYGIDPDTVDEPGEVTVTELEVLREENAYPEIRLRVRNTGARNLYNVQVVMELQDSGGEVLWDEVSFYLEPTKIPTDAKAKGSVTVFEEGFADVAEVRAEDVLGPVEVHLPE